MDFANWAIQIPQVCCILPVVLLIILSVVSFGLDVLRSLIGVILWLILLPFRIIYEVLFG